MELQEGMQQISVQSMERARWADVPNEVTQLVAPETAARAEAEVDVEATLELNLPAVPPYPMLKEVQGGEPQGCEQRDTQVGKTELESEVLAEESASVSTYPAARGMKPGAKKQAAKRKAMKQARDRGDAPDCHRAADRGGDDGGRGAQCHVRGEAHS